MYFSFWRGSFLFFCASSFLSIESWQNREVVEKCFFAKLFWRKFTFLKCLLNTDAIIVCLLREKFTKAQTFLLLGLSLGQHSQKWWSLVNLSFILQICFKVESHASLASYFFNVLSSFEMKKFCFRCRAFMDRCALMSSRLLASPRSVCCSRLRGGRWSGWLGTEIQTRLKLNQDWTRLKLKQHWN